MPEEIKAIREQYGLSQRSFSKLLNWGDKTIFRYENGSIQDKAHNSLLVLLRDSRNMSIFLNENEVSLDEKKTDKLRKTIFDLQTENQMMSNRRFMEFVLAKEPSEDNGFKSFDYEKFCAMILYFSKNSPGLLKTKLLKLLNYSDMLFYKENGVSITGTRYLHYQYGPVPDNFEMLFGMLAADHIAHVEVTYEHQYERHEVIPECAIPKNVLNKKEIMVIKRVLDKFASFGSAEISNFSHKEKGYMVTKPNEVISYAYAKDIKI